MNLMRHNGIASLSEMRRLYDLSSMSNSPLVERPVQVAPVYKGGGDKATLENKRYNAKHEKAMYDYLRQKGLNHQQTSGLLGNLSVESYLNADLHQFKGPAYGLMQAEAGRQRAMRGYNEVPYQFGSNLSPEEQQQLDYIVDKGINSYTPGEWGRKGYSGARQARQAFIDAKDTQTASDIITNNFLRPGKPQMQRRRNMSEYYDDKYANMFPYNMEKYQEGLEFKSGGSKIHIKKENRGKFTALKKRTGHSASWFKAHGTPAQKKMAIFALNAKKWKHSHGGIKF